MRMCMRASMCVCVCACVCRRCAAIEKMWMAEGDGAPDWLIDYWMPMSNLPPHQHPCGAYYFVVEGTRTHAHIHT